ncbi:MAG: type IV pilus inner membrane component PilO [Armatimonadota bacterium]
MLNIRPSKNVFIALICVGILLVGACGFIYFTQAKKLGKLQAVKVKKQETLTNSQVTARRLDEVEARYLDAQATLGVLEKGVSTKAYVPTLLRQMEDLGKSVNLRVVGVRPQVQVVAPVADGEEKAEPEPYDKLNLDIEVNGKYKDVVNFLSEITRFPKIVAVNSVQISPVGATDRVKSPMLSVKLSCTAFILKSSTKSVKVAEVSDEDRS